MSRHTSPYKGATCIRTIDATITAECENKGAYAIVSLYDGLASHGWRTGYERIPKRWLTLRVTRDGKVLVKQCWSYSGARWDKAENDWRHLAENLREVSQPAEERAL